MKNISAETIAALAGPIAEQHGAFLVEVLIRGQRGNTVVEVFADTDTGITTDECARISQELSRALDQDNVISQRYHLVVSSPGLERPLKFVRQYRRHVGRKLSVSHRTAADAAVLTATGTLVGTTDEGILLRGTDDAEQVIPFASIVEAKVLPAW